MSNIKVSPLALSILQWAVNQTFGTKIGNKINTVLVPLAQALNDGADLKTALTTIAAGLLAGA